MKYSKSGARLTVHPPCLEGARKKTRPAHQILKPLSSAWKVTATKYYAARFPWPSREGIEEGSVPEMQLPAYAARFGAACFSVATSGRPIAIASIFGLAVRD